MLQSEFYIRTQVHVTSEMFEQIHKDYMQSDLDKDAFCKQWKRRNASDATQQMVDQIRELRTQLEAEKAKRVAEREHAQKELLDALHERSAYCAELIRIFDIKGDYKQIHAMQQRIKNKYYQNQ